MGQERRGVDWVSVVFVLTIVGVVAAMILAYMGVVRFH